MVDVDEHLSLTDAITHLAEALEAGAVSGDDAVEFPAWGGEFEELLRVEKVELGRHGILVPAGHLLAFVFQRQREAELGTDAIAIRTNVADDTDRLAVANGLNDFLNDAGRLHASEGDCSSSSSNCKMRSPRVTDSSTRKRRCGVYLRITAWPTMP